jgi:hypothetical protein
MLAVCTTSDTAHIDTIFSSEEYRCTHIDVCGKNLNIVSMYAVSPVMHTSNTSSCQKISRFFGFLVINISNHRKHYETPCIFLVRNSYRVSYHVVLSDR